MPLGIRSIPIFKSMCNTPPRTLSLHLRIYVTLGIRSMPLFKSMCNSPPPLFQEGYSSREGALPPFTLRRFLQVLFGKVCALTCLFFFYYQIVGNNPLSPQLFFFFFFVLCLISFLVPYDIVNSQKLVYYASIHSLEEDLVPNNPGVQNCGIHRGIELRFHQKRGRYLLHLLLKSGSELGGTFANLQTRHHECKETPQNMLHEDFNLWVGLKMADFKNSLVDLLSGFQD